MLNDGWVSHPTWASEEAGFVAHKKNSFEEALHKSEEERHEYTVLIQGLARTIAVLEPLNERIDEMSAEERAEFKLRNDLGGTSPCIYVRTLRKIYRDDGKEIYKALQDNPSVAVPVVLGRLRQKDEEWRRAQREWSKTWREVDHKNFYKSLDHQGIAFKVNDKKAITSKHFVSDIDAARFTQARRRRAGLSAIPEFARGSAGPQLDYTFTDMDVIHDALRLVYAFLDHNAAYHPAERRQIENFLREFVPVLLMLPPQDFTSGSGPRASENAGLAPRSDPPDVTMGSADSIGQKLVNGDVEVAQSGTHLPAADISKESRKQKNKWVREATTSVPNGVNLFSITPVKRKPFFANTTFYTLLRLLQVRKSSLPYLTCNSYPVSLKSAALLSLEHMQGSWREARRRKVCVTYG